MKLTKIAIACGLAFAAGSAAAADESAGYTKILLSGATAPDNFMQSIATSMLNNVTSFRDAATRFRAFRGDAKPGIISVAGGEKIIIQKRSKGGSVWGVDPVARANRIEVIDFNACVNDPDPNWDFVCTLKGIDPGLSGNNSPSNPGEVPDFGVSDVEPAMFQEPYNTENDQPALTAAERGRLQAFPVSQLMMGIVATNAVPDTLSISRSQYGAMLTKNGITSWDLIEPTIDPDASYAQVVVCRRVEGSGTQTSYNWFFNNFPCQTPAGGSTEPARVTDSDGVGSGTGTVADPILVDPTAGYTVVENSTSGDVRNCLARAQSLTDHTVVGSNDLNYKIQFSKGQAVNGGKGTPFRAVGTLSLDSYKSANPDNNGWHFRPLDGAGKYNANSQACASAACTGMAPSKANLVNGAYDFVVELSMQYRTVDVTNVNGDLVRSLNDPSNALKKAFITKFITNAGDPLYTADTTGTLNSVPNAYASIPLQEIAGEFVGFDPYATANAGKVGFYSRSANTCSPLKRF
jgi:hypothetical protein